MQDLMEQMQTLRRKLNNTIKELETRGVEAWNAISIGRITAITTGGFHAWRKGEVI